MDYLGMISSLLPGLAFMFMGFSEKGGGKEEEEEEEEKEEEETEEESTIKQIQKDPDAVSRLLEQKRSANAQAKDLRLELKTLKDAAEKLTQEELKKKGEFEQLSAKLEADNASKAAKFKARMILKELQVEAIGFGMINKGDVSLADLTGVDFNDETYEVTGAKDAVEALKKKSPYLFKGKKKDDDSDETEEEAPETEKGKMKTNIKKFDAEKTPNLIARFGLGEGKKKKG